MPADRVRSAADEPAVIGDVRVPGVEAWQQAADSGAAAQDRSHPAPGRRGASWRTALDACLGRAAFPHP